jgi:para-aminobenzoate synthetase/4-amino-4-deoxychorismate lyase
MTEPWHPDTNCGVFETLLAVDGEPVELEAHLARIDASLRRLFDRPLPERAVAAVRGAARSLDLGRVRLTVAPDAGGDLATDVTSAAVERDVVLPRWERALELGPLTVPGGIGAEKWADRSLLATAEAQARPSLPLVVDRDGTLLEASRGNVFLVADGALATPPADGRILPGVARRRVLELARALGFETRETPLASADVERADEVFVTGSVRGVEPVRAVVGLRRWKPGPVTATLAASLGERWLGEPAGAVAQPLRPRRAR